MRQLHRSGCLIGDLLQQWWALQRRELAGLRLPTVEAEAPTASRISHADACNLTRDVQSWIKETYAELATFRQLLDSGDLPPGDRFATRKARSAFEVLSDPRGYRDLVLDMTARDLLSIAASFYAECAGSLTEPRG